MLTIRLQRTGRKGHAMFRLVVQDARLAPTSGKVVARLGSYDPHAKTVELDKTKAEFYLNHGAQPSGRLVKLLEAEGVKLPAWVKRANTSKAASTRNPDKLRSNRPAEPSAETAAQTEQPEPDTAPETAGVEPAETEAKADQS